MWRNRHVVAALLIAPVLAVLGWLAVDALIGERPQAARAGMSYPLLPGPSCRRPGGVCVLENTDVRLTVGVSRAGGALAVSVESALPLDGVRIGRATADASAPTRLVAANAAGTRWRGTLPAERDGNPGLRLAAKAGESLYFAELPAVFIGGRP